MAKSINRVGVRASLKVRRAPYWQRLEQGKYVGFRRLSASTPGSWLARYYDGEDYQQKPLGDLATLPDEQRFDEAKRQAEEWFRHLDLGGATEKVTVKAACEAYAAKLRRERSEAAAKDAEGRFIRLVDSDSLGKIELAKIKPAHVLAWRERVMEIGSKSYFNRNATALRAALNLAYDERKVSSDFAWQKALRPLKLDATEGRRDLYLDVDQRRRLLDKATDELKPLVKSWMLLPVRPGDVAQLKVEHLNVKQRSLTIPMGKTASHTIPLTAEALEHFKGCARDKLPQAWLVSRGNGGQWDRFAWRDEMQAAVKAAKLPRATVAYTLRHSTITDLVTAGVDLFTVAKLSGTSVAMIDKHYGKLRQEHARKALEQLTLKL
jgi:site-specific recombinase XerD